MSKARGFDGVGTSGRCSECRTGPSVSVRAVRSLHSHPFSWGEEIHWKAKRNYDTLKKCSDRNGIAYGRAPSPWMG
jgi:hypothetical protein